MRGCRGVACRVGGHGGQGFRTFTKGGDGCCAEHSAPGGGRDLRDGGAVQGGGCARLVAAGDRDGGGLFCGVDDVVAGHRVDDGGGRGKRVHADAVRGCRGVACGIGGHGGQGFAALAKQVDGRRAEHSTPGGARYCGGNTVQRDCGARLCGAGDRDGSISLRNVDVVVAGNRVDHGGGWGQRVNGLHIVGGSGVVVASRIDGDVGGHAGREVALEVGGGDDDQGVDRRTYGGEGALGAGGDAYVCGIEPRDRLAEGEGKQDVADGGGGLVVGDDNRGWRCIVNNIDGESA